MRELFILCLWLLVLSCHSNNPNQGNSASGGRSGGGGGQYPYVSDGRNDPYYNRVDQQKQQQHNYQQQSQQQQSQQQQQQQQQQQHQANQYHNGQQQHQQQQYQQHQQYQQQHQPQQQPYLNGHTPYPNHQTAPVIEGPSSGSNERTDRKYPGTPSNTGTVGGTVDPSKNPYQPVQTPVNLQNTDPYEVNPPGDDSDEKYGPEIEDADDDLFMGLDRAVAGDSILRAVDIAASLEDGPGSHTVLPASPSQVHGQGAPPQSSASQVLFGSDLSQLDKDLIFDGLKKLYKKKVLPLEIASKYSHFGSPPLGPSDFEAKPMVLILGQYSVGKTSFIRSLVKQDFPGQRIGPEPTTDRFTAIMHSTEGNEGGRQIPGHALVMQQDRPFRGLASFGNNFLSKFEGAEVTASILRNITIVDTPGVLAGEKQRIGRDYDFGEVIKWFAERADMIIVMFDAHKLDISDELKTVLDVLKPHQDKIRVLLNKADTIDAQALLRVYGSLMWSLGKVVQTPEVCRVFLGSFWEAPLKLQDNRQLLEREKQDLLNEMMALPQNAVVRRINELVKRARSVKVHAYIIHYLKKQMPYVIGKSEKQKKLLDRLDREFLACARRYNLPLGDFPNVDQYRKMLREIKDISDFKRLDKNMVAEMDRVLTHDIPLLLQKATNSPVRRPHAQQQQQQQQHLSNPSGLSHQDPYYQQHNQNNQHSQQQHPSKEKKSSRRFFW